MSATAVTVTVLAAVAAWAFVFTLTFRACQARHQRWITTGIHRLEAFANHPANRRTP